MTRMDDLQLRLQSLEMEILEELHGLREGRGYHLEGRRVRIQETIRKAHRARRKRVRIYLWEGRLAAYLVGPAFSRPYSWICSLWSISSCASRPTEFRA